MGRWKERWTWPSYSLWQLTRHSWFHLMSNDQPIIHWGAEGVPNIRVFLLWILTIHDIKLHMANFISWGTTWQSQHCFSTSYFSNYSLNTYTDNGQLQGTSNRANNILIRALFIVFRVEKTALNLQIWPKLTWCNVLWNLTHIL